MKSTDTELDVLFAEVGRIRSVIARDRIDPYAREIATVSLDAILKIATMMQAAHNLTSSMLMDAEIELQNRQGS